MHRINRNGAKKLAKDPISFAIMLNDEQLEQVIATFVSVLNKRKTRDRGG
jgi:hypothetical protein